MTAITRPLRHWLDGTRPLTYGIVQAGEHVPDGVPYIRPTDMTETSGVPEPESLLRTSPEIAKAYSRAAVQTGDVILSIGPSYGKVMVVPSALAGANLTQGTARLSPSGAVHNEWLYWALQSKPARDFWAACAAGGTFRALNLGPLGETPLLVPPIEEQKRVADFLDDQVSRIDQAVSMTRVQGLLIAESNAAWWGGVVRWLNEAHSSVPLRRFVDGVEQGSSPLAGGNAAPSSGFGVIKTSSITSGTFVESENKELLGTNDFESRFEVCLGDVLVVRGSGSSDLVADAAWVRSQPSARLMLSDLTFRLVRPRMLPGYLTAVLLSHSVRGQVRSLVRQGSGPAKVRAEDVKQLFVPVPASPTQTRVSDEYWQRRAELGGNTELLEQRAMLLEERKRALITAAVTGEFDVTTATGRGVA